MFKNVKDSYYGLMADVTCQLMNPSQKDKRAYAGATAVGALAGCMQVAMAEKSLTDSMNSLFSEGFNLLAVLANGYFILSIAIDVMRYRSSDPQKSRTGKDGLIRGVACLIIFNMLGVLVKAVINAAGKGNSGLGDQTSGTFGN